MLDLFVFLFLAAIVIFVVGMVKPSLFQRFSKKPITRKMIAVPLIAAAFVFFILIGIYAPKTPENTSKPAETQKTVAKLYDVVKVVDGDTLDVNIDGKTERIRL